MRPNIVLIVFDTARADAFEPYGAARGATPAVADLASRGWAATRAYSTSNWTLPSHASLFTGMMPRSMGFGIVDANARDVLALSRDKMLAPILKGAGYTSYGASANPWISKGYGFNYGFDDFRVAPNTRRHEPNRGRRARLHWTLEALLARLDDGLAAISSWTDGWVAQATSPFFMFVNLMECHSPYFPPRPYNFRSPLTRYKAAMEARTYTWHRGALDVATGRLQVPAPALRRMQYLYRRAVLSMDVWLGRFLEDLDRRKMLDDTVVIVTSDHGEGFGECGVFGHGLTLAEVLVRVPLVIAGPNVGERRELMSLADVPAFIGATAEIADHPWPSRESALLTAESDGMHSIGTEALSSVINSWGLDDETAQLIQRLYRSATDGRFKLVREDGTERLYDLASDPLESTDLSAVQPDVARLLREAIEATAAKDASPALAAEIADEDGSDDADDLEARMRLLGYL